MTGNAKQHELEPLALHELRNQLSIIVGFCEILLSEMPETDPKRGDVVEIGKAVDAAMAILSNWSAPARPRNDVQP